MIRIKEKETIVQMFVQMFKTCIEILDKITSCINLSGYHSKMLITFLYTISS